MKIKIDSSNIEVLDNIDDIVQLCSKKKPPWWYKVPPFKYGIQTVQQLFSDLRVWLHEVTGTPATIIHCPGIKKYFTNSIIVRFPCDVAIQTHQDGSYTWRTPALNVCNVEQHGTDQYLYGEDNPLANFINIKFTPNVQVGCDRGSVDFLTTDSMYHGMQPYRVMPGILPVVNGKYGNSVAAIVLFPKIDASYLFRKGSPMMILYANKPIESIEKKKMVMQLSKFTFLNTYKDMVNNREGK